MQVSEWISPRSAFHSVVEIESAPCEYSVSNHYTFNERHRLHKEWVILLQVTQDGGMGDSPPVSHVERPRSDATMKSLSVLVVDDGLCKQNVTTIQRLSPNPLLAVQMRTWH